MRRAVVTAGLVAVVASPATATIPAHGLAATGRDPAYARRTVLKISDLPPGWTAKNSPSTCKVLAHQGTTGYAASALFRRGDRASVRSVAAVFATAPRARRGFAASVRLNHAKCLRSAAQKSLGKDIGITRLSGSPLSFRRYGDRTMQNGST
jgi:hypothetical protein